MKNMIKIQPYSREIDEEDNMSYNFTFVGRKKYKCKLTVDELNDNKLHNMACECADFYFRKRLDIKKCKHIEEALKILKDFEVEIREI